MTTCMTTTTIGPRLLRHHLLRRVVLATQERSARRFGSFHAPDSLLESCRQSKPWPPWLRQEMRSNWAGETGAVWIYRGCQSALSRAGAKEKAAAAAADDRTSAAAADLQGLATFVDEHLASEEAHLAAMDAVVCEGSERSWMPAALCGWWLGAHGMYVTTHAVEYFVEEHYGDQISRLRGELENGQRQPEAAYRDLLALLESACADEVHHKEDAALRTNGAGETGGSAADRVQFSLVYWGSRVGAAIAKRI
eukprot:TRINITY_DN16181_c0_g1_i2.p1 TRINITY_DN16181_c0_g1~~TRINITY_DN16181_c0_g1_i2.p1  ORF type:complete len:252 (-),score=42.96 TRINITY_DN16181_c0_g1_i2:401-1156(-)